MDRENRYLEYKQNIESKTYLKTISAFANYEGGKIVFGIADDYSIVGIEDCEQACLDLENNINGNFSPTPDYSLEIQDNQTIILTVTKGRYTPYLFKGKAYKRHDSSTVEVSKEELKMLILKGENLSFEQLPSNMQSLSFEVLNQKLQEILGVKQLTEDIQKTLGFKTEEGEYNIAAELLSDNNSFLGIDIVRFGETINEISERADFSHISIIQQLENSMDMFKRYYQYELIETASRIVKDKIPERAFRETIANALVHRMWEIKSAITVSFYPDRIEVVSPGGLPDGLSEEEYLDGMVSLSRNEILAGVFYRLKYIEKFGTGILRIKNSYQSSIAKPKFIIHENSIKVILPVIQEQNDLSENAKKVYTALLESEALSRLEIEGLTKFSKDKTIRLLNELLEKDIIEKAGVGRAVKYRIKK